MQIALCAPFSVLPAAEGCWFAQPPGKFAFYCHKKLKLLSWGLQSRSAQTNAQENKSRAAPSNAMFLHVCLGAARTGSAALTGVQTGGFLRAWGGGCCVALCAFAWGLQPSANRRVSCAHQLCWSAQGATSVLRSLCSLRSAQGSFTASGETGVAGARRKPYGPCSVLRSLYSVLCAPFSVLPAAEGCWFAQPPGKFAFYLHSPHKSINCFPARTGVAALTAPCTDRKGVQSTERV
jgi:hypothetical protein